MKSSFKLNKEQKKAVSHGSGSVLIIAGAGTGKTAVLTNRIAYLIKSKKAKAEEILALTFTEKAAGQMQDRADKLLSIGYSDPLTAGWISTFHSFAERVLRERGLDIGLNTDFKILDDTKAWLFLRKNLSKFDFDYYKSISNPSKFIKALISLFSRCKDQNISPEDYLEYANGAREDKERLLEIANAYKKYQELLLDNSYMDFGDLINYCLLLFKKRPLILEKYRKQFKYVLVDEFQDTNWAQYELLKMLVFPENNLMAVADDDQCLPGDAMVETLNGKKEIKNIKENDLVLTAVGKGHIGISKVNKVFKNQKNTELLTIKTFKGFQTTVTDNHKMFCFIPRTFKKEYHYVYLMYRQDIGWRIGVTNDLITRLKLERSADKILAIKAFKSDEEARYCELFYSLKYGIPTSCFKEREGIIIKDKLLAKLYKEIDVEENIKKLAQEINIDLNYHHYCLGAVNRGNKTRIKINLLLCYRRYRNKDHVKNQKFLIVNPLIIHRTVIETSDKSTIQKLLNNKFNLKKAKKGMKFYYENSNLLKVINMAEKIKRITGAVIETKFNLASKLAESGNKNHIRTYNSLIAPAKNLVLGSYVPVIIGREIVYDKIISIKKKRRNIKVYDLEINKTHNFIANGIVVHNSIYKFRGASFSNIKQFNKDFPKAENIVLTRNYRSFQGILDLAYRFIQKNNPERLEYVSKISKRLKAENKGKAEILNLSFETLEQEAQGTAFKIIELLKKDKKALLSDFAVLIRANSYGQPFFRAFERANIPFQFLARKGLYSRPVIMDIISYLKLLDNYHENSAFYRILNLPFLKIGFEDIAKITYFSNKKAISIYEALFLIEGIPNKNKILSLIKKHSELSSERNVSEIIFAFLEDSGYLEYLTKKGSKEDFSHINSFFEKAKMFESENAEAKTKNFVRELDLEMESGEEGNLEFEDENSVKIMTVHAAKGLEFKYVFIVNLVDKRFPTTEKKEQIEIPEPLVKDIISEKDFHLQEERRLFFVALTRAKQGLYLMSSKNYGGEREKKASLFLKELDKKPEDRKIEDISSKPELSNGKEIINLPDRFSFTQLVAFKICPLQYKFRHILKIPVKGKASLVFGKTIHNTLAELVLKRQEKELKIDEVIKIYEDNWIDDWYESKKQKEEYHELGKGIIKRFYNDFTKEKPEICLINGKPAIEQKFKLKIGEDVLIGKIDRIDNIGRGVEIIDYKTGKGKEKIDSGEKTQLLLYQIAAKEVLGINPQKLTYYYIENGKKLSFLGTEKEIEKEKEKIASQIEKMKKRDFKATPGWDCGFCDYNNICEFSKK